MAFSAGVLIVILIAFVLFAIKSCGCCDDNGREKSGADDESAQPLKGEGRDLESGDGGEEWSDDGDDWGHDTQQQQPLVVGAAGGRGGGLHSGSSSSRSSVRSRNSSGGSLSSSGGAEEAAAAAGGGPSSGKSGGGTFSVRGASPSGGKTTSTSALGGLGSMVGVGAVGKDKASPAPKVAGTTPGGGKASKGNRRTSGGDPDVDLFAALGVEASPNFDKNKKKESTAHKQQQLQPVAAAVKIATHSKISASPGGMWNDDDDYLDGLSD
jgi:hypothetical protein